MSLHHGGRGPGHLSRWPKAAGGVAPPPPDTTPDAFTFTDVSDAGLSTAYESNTITVSGLGIGVSVAVSVTGGQYSKNGGAYTSGAGTAVNGDTFKLKVTSSASNETAVSATLTISSVSDTWTVTTEAASVGVTTTFGALTLVGAAGVPVTGATIASGDSNGHWQISSGKIAPSSTGASAGLNAGPYSLTLDNGQTVAITIAAGEYSVGNRTELLAVKALGAATYTGKTIRLRDDGDYIGDGTAIDWSNETPAALVTITGDTNRGPLTPGFSLISSARIRITAMRHHRNLVAPETSTNAVITVNASTALAIDDNEIWSDSLADVLTAAYANSVPAETLTGIGYYGTVGVTGITVTNNYIHDTAQSVKLAGSGINYSNNLCVDALKNFGIFGPVMDSLTVVGNRGIGIWNNSEDPGGPHSSLCSFQPADVNSANITIEGNIWLVGTNRKDAMGDKHGFATGPKFNVTSTGILSNVSVRNNLCVCNGNIAFEFAQVVNSAIEWNTLAFTEDTIDGTGGLPLLSYYEVGEGCSISNNVVGQIYAGAAGGNDPSLVIANNEEIPRASYSSKFVGPFTGVTLANALARFAPLAGSTMLTADPKRGAVGTGYYDWDTDTGTWPEPTPPSVQAGYVGRFTDNANKVDGDSYTLNTDLGGADPDRVVVVVIESTVLLSGGATLGGIAMTQGPTSSTTVSTSSLATYYLPTGGTALADATTAELVITNSSGNTASHCDVLVYVGYPASKTIKDSGSSTVNQSTTASVSLDTEVGGLAFAVGQILATSTDRVLAWGGADAVTVDVNASTEGTTAIVAGHVDTTEAVTANLTLTATNSGSKKFVAFSFGAPA